jgi:hypothetical protein
MIPPSFKGALFCLSCFNSEAIIHDIKSKSNNGGGGDGRDERFELRHFIN